MFTQVLELIRQTRTHLAAGDYLAAARSAHELVGLFLAPRTFGAADEGADLDLIQAEWEGCEEAIKGAKAPVGAAAPAGMDPAFWLMLVQVLGPVIADWLRRRRQGG